MARGNAEGTWGKKRLSKGNGCRGEKKREGVLVMGDGSGGRDDTIEMLICKEETV